MKKIVSILFAAVLLLSLSACTTGNTSLQNALAEQGTLQQQYDYAKEHGGRDLGDLQSETGEIVVLEGKCYQSYVSNSVDMRYIFVSQSEYDMSSAWDWLPIGTAAEYSLDNLGKISDSQR